MEKKNSSTVWKVTTVIFAIIAIVFGSEGLFWNFKHYDLEVLQRRVNLRLEEEQILNNITLLNNEYYSYESERKLNEVNLQNFINRFDLLWDNLNTFEKELAELENREPKFFPIPSPIKDVLPPELVGAEILDSDSIKLNLNF